MRTLVFITPIFLSLFAGCSGSSSESDNYIPPSEALKDSERQEEVSPYEYEIANKEESVNREDLNTDSDKLIKKTIEIVVDKKATSEKRLTATLDKIYNHEKVDSLPLSIFITAYPKGTQVGGAPYYARLKKPHTKGSPTTEVDHSYIKSFSTNKRERKHGLTVKKRKEFYKDWMKAEYQAMDEADKKYEAGTKKHRQAINRFTKRNKKQVLSKYGLSSMKKGKEIANEGISKNWEGP